MLITSNEVNIYCSYSPVLCPLFLYLTLPPWMHLHQAARTAAHFPHNISVGHKAWHESYTSMLDWRLCPEVLFVRKTSQLNHCYRKVMAIWKNRKTPVIIQSCNQEIIMQWLNWAFICCIKMRWTHKTGYEKDRIFGLYNIREPNVDCILLHSTKMDYFHWLTLTDLSASSSVYNFGLWLRGLRKTPLLSANPSMR